MNAYPQSMSNVSIQTRFWQNHSDVALKTYPQQVSDVGIPEQDKGDGETHNALKFVILWIFPL